MAARILKGHFVPFEHDLENKHLKIDRDHINQSESIFTGIQKFFTKKSGSHKIDMTKSTMEELIKGVDGDNKEKIALVTSQRSELCLDWQEKYIDKLDQNISAIKEDLRQFESRLTAMVNQALTSNQQLLSQIQHLDNQRHDEIIESNRNNERNVSEIRKEITDSNKWFKGLVIAVVIGIFSIAVGVLLAVLRNPG